MKSPISRVGIVVKPGLARIGDVVEDLAGWLDAHDVVPVFNPTSGAVLRNTDRTIVAAEELPATVELIVVLGGDGTLLATAGWIARAAVDVPVLAVNFGSLGFLTETTLPELHAALELALRGEASIEERLMLHAEIIRAGRRHHATPVLNDVVINRGPMGRMADLSVSIDDHFAARFKADGLIIATATGSTAYNLSAGGPIVHPGVDALVLTPIAPHTLTNRPVVVPGASVLAVQPFGDGTQEMIVMADGQTGHSLTGDDVVRVARAARPLRLVRSTTRSYFAVLREKLKWAER
jgi:NAD+ kinase